MQIYSINKPIIGMIHVAAMPGTPKHSLSPDKIIKKAIKEAQLYKKAGIDILAIENMHDIPYQNRKTEPQVIALMAIIAYEIKRETDLTCGIQILAGANKEAIGVAFASGIDFIRAEGFVFGHIADEGYIDSDAAELLRFRKNIGANKIKIFTDIKKKHSSHLITADISIEETAKSAEFFLSDGIIVTGNQTGIEPSEYDLINVKQSTALPLIIGSGITIDNINKFFPLADAFIIGSYFKENGLWSNDIEYDKINRFMETIFLLRDNL